MAVVQSDHTFVSFYNYRHKWRCGSNFYFFQILLIPELFILIPILLSEWLFFNANSAIFQLYHGKNKLIFNEMMRSTLYKTNTLSWNFLVQAHWNNSPWVDMSLHSDTFFWFRANQSLLLLLNAACLAEKKQIPIS